MIIITNNFTHFLIHYLQLFKNCKKKCSFVIASPVRAELSSPTKEESLNKCRVCDLENFLKGFNHNDH